MDMENTAENNIAQTGKRRIFIAVLFEEMTRTASKAYLRPRQDEILHQLDLRIKMPTHLSDR
jgi:hypothetical protein